MIPKNTSESFFKPSTFFSWLFTSFYGCFSHFHYISYLALNTCWAWWSLKKYDLLICLGRNDKLYTFNIFLGSSLIQRKEHELDGEIRVCLIVALKKHVLCLSCVSWALSGLCRDRGDQDRWGAVCWWRRRTVKSTRLLVVWHTVSGSKWVKGIWGDGDCQEAVYLERISEKTSDIWMNDIWMKGES